MRLDVVDIDDDVLAKIWRKHGVTFEEAEEVSLSRDRVIRRWREELVKVFGQTDAGRYLIVLLAWGRDRTWWVVTARDMTLPERRSYAKAHSR